jgi:hypothetical protein
MFIGRVAGKAGVVSGTGELSRRFQYFSLGARLVASDKTCNMESQDLHLYLQSEILLCQSWARCWLPLL